MVERLICIQEVGGSMPSASIGCSYLSFTNSKHIQSSVRPARPAGTLLRLRALQQLQGCVSYEGNSSRVLHYVVPDGINC